MKKSRLFIIFALPLLLTGCDKIIVGEVTFKDNLEFKREIGIAEKTLVEGKVAEEVHKHCTQIEITMTYSVSYINSEIKQDGKATYYFYNNLYMNSVSESTVYQKDNGVGLSQTVKENKEVFDDPELQSIVAYTERSGGQNTSYSRNSYTDETAATVRDEFHNKYLDQAVVSLNVPSDAKMYETNDGKYAIVSSKIETEKSEVTWCGETKEEIHIEKSQVILGIDKDNHITGYTYYAEELRNRDPEGEWYSNTKSTGVMKMRATFKYGTLVDASQDKINAAKAKVAGNYLVGPSLEVTYGKYDASSKTYTGATSVTVNSNRTTIGFAKYRYEATFTLPEGTDTNNAFRVKISGNIYDKWNSTTYTNKIKDIKLADFNSATTTSGIVVNIIPTGKVYQVVLMFEVAAVSGDISVNMITQEAFEK